MRSTTNPPPPPNRSPSDSPRPATILVADDEPVILTICEAALGDLDPPPRVVTVVNGDQAIRAIDRDRPDLVITDIRMPGTDGLQLLAHVVSERLAVPVIAMTGFATPELRDEVMSGGAFVLLEKPLDPEEIVRVARMALASNDRRGFQGFSIYNIFQLIEMEAKSCEVSVVANDGGGFLVFDEGRLTHASLHQLTGNAAVIKMLSMPEPRIDIRDSVGPHPSTVSRAMSYLLTKSSHTEGKVDPQVFETVTIEREPVNEQPDGLAKYRALINSLKYLRGFAAATLIDTVSSEILLAESTESTKDVLASLSAAPACRLIAAEKALMTGTGPEPPSHVLIRHPKFWHLLREVGDGLVLHLVFSGKANIGLAQYRLSHWLAGSGPETS